MWAVKIMTSDHFNKWIDGSGKLTSDIHLRRYFTSLEGVYIAIRDIEYEIKVILIEKYSCFLNPTSC